MRARLRCEMMIKTGCHCACPFLRLSCFRKHVILTVCSAACGPCAVRLGLGLGVFLIRPPLLCCAFLADASESASPSTRLAQLPKPKQISEKLAALSTLPAISLRSFLTLSPSFLSTNRIGSHLQASPSPSPRRVCIVHTRPHVDRGSPILSPIYIQDHLQGSSFPVASWQLLSLRLASTHLNSLSSTVELSHRQEPLIPTHRARHRQPHTACLATVPPSH